MSRFPIPLEMIEEYVQLRDSSVAKEIVSQAVSIFTTVFTAHMGKEATANELLQACLEHEEYSNFTGQPEDMARVVELSLDYFEITGLYE